MVDCDRVIVVGSGPTGAITAWTLVNAGISVTMLESGESYPRNLRIRLNNRDIRRPVTPSINDQCDYAEFVNLDDCSTRWIKADCQGGRSNFWSGIVLRYAEQDFCEGERLHPKYKWPITYGDLESYYRRVEALIRVRGGTQSYPALPACHVAHKRSISSEWEQFEQVSHSLNHSLAILPDVYGPDTSISMNPTPQNLAVRLLGKLRRSKRFQLISNAHVHRVLVHPHQPMADAVEYIDRKRGDLHHLSGQSVVLAAGPLSSAQILMNSKCSSFPDGLGNSQGILGRYLHDHPMSYTKIESDFIFDKLDDRDVGGLYITRDRYETAQPLQTFALCLYGGPQQRRAVNLHQGLTQPDTHASDSPMPKDKNWMMAVCFGTQVPSYDNHVSLHSSHKDKFGLPLLQISTRFSETELQTMQRGRELVPKILSEIDHQSVELSSQLHPPGTSVHYGGTTRMHASPDYGVVDAWNRVHNIQNLFVVDAGCFTTCVEKNPTLTAMAIAMRAADKLAQTTQ